MLDVENAIEVLNPKFGLSIVGVKNPLPCFHYKISPDENKRKELNLFPPLLLVCVPLKHKRFQR